MLPGVGVNLLSLKGIACRDGQGLSGHGVKSGLKHQLCMQSTYRLKEPPQQTNKHPYDLAVRRQKYTNNHCDSTERGVPIRMDSLLQNQHRVTTNSAYTRETDQSCSSHSKLSAFVNSLLPYHNHHYTENALRTSHGSCRVDINHCKLASARSAICSSARPNSPRRRYR